MADNKENKTINLNTTKNTTPNKETKTKKEIHRRSAEEIVAAIQKKIDYHTACIASLEKKKATALMPSKGKQVKEAIQNALASGMTMDEITARLSNNPNPAAL